MDIQDNQSKWLVKQDDAPSFSEKELQELNEYMDKGGPRIAVDRATNFLTLYLEGRSVEQIHSRFPQWPKGALLRARHEYGWDLAREEYVTSLTKEVAGRLAKVKSEVVHYLLDNLAVTHKEFSREMERYLQNPDKEAPPRNRIKSIREYREVIKAFGDALNLGQPTKPADGNTPSIGVAVQVNAAEGSVVKITSAERTDTLKVLSGEKENNTKK